jgi:hypothetical protein
MNIYEVLRTDKSDNFKNNEKIIRETCSVKCILENYSYRANKTVFCTKMFLRGHKKELMYVQEEKNTTKYGIYIHIYIYKLNFYFNKVTQA